MEGLGAAGNLDGLPLAERAWRGFQAIGCEDVDSLAVDLEAVAELRMGRGWRKKFPAQLVDRRTDVLRNARLRPRIAK